MKRVAIREIAAEVAALMGESLLLECQPEESLFPDLEEQVRIRAPAILSDLILESPPEHLADAGKRMEANPTIDESGTVTLELPEDFLRLLYVRMSDWVRGATELIPFSSPEAARHFSKWKGIRGTRECPAAIRGFTPEGKQCIKLYSSGKDAFLETALYIPFPALDSDEILEVPERLMPVLLDRLQKVHPSFISPTMR